MNLSVVFVFSIFGLLGPFIFFVSRIVGFEDYVDNLVSLLWVTGSLSVLEYSLGKIIACSIAIAANVGLYGLIGRAVGRTGSFVRYSVIFLITMIFLAAFGYLMNGFAPLSLAIVTGLWLLVFLVALEISKRSNAIA